MASARTILIFCLLALTFHPSEGRAEGVGPFSGVKAKEQFVRAIASAIESSWKKWQDAVTIDDIDIEGSRGVLLPGDMKGRIISVSDIMAGFREKSSANDKYARVVAYALAEGLGKWQRGYVNDNLPFPQGDASMFTMSPENNIPVTVDSGNSLGEGDMDASALYRKMIYESPAQDEDTLAVLRAASDAIAACFAAWKKTCSIAGVVGSGGIAPGASPIGAVPGPVRGAQGHGGKLVGPYFDGGAMYEMMMDKLRR